MKETQKGGQEVKRKEKTREGKGRGGKGTEKIRGNLPSQLPL